MPPLGNLGTWEGAGHQRGHTKAATPKFRVSPGSPGGRNCGHASIIDNALPEPARTAALDVIPTPTSECRPPGALRHHVRSSMTLRL